MSNDLKELIRSATGRSERVVVVFLDVRGFTSFANFDESVNTAEFLKTVYVRILDDYFREPAFVKPTGDGLLILLRYHDDDSLKAVLELALRRSIELVEQFPTICDGAPMINFDVPSDLGIGIARGAATALVAGDTLIDYSGRPLNLAARLMDMARPSGVVCDGRLGIDLMEQGLQERFVRESVYVKGVSEEDPMAVYCLAGRTESPAQYRSPARELVRHAESPEVVAFSEFMERGLKFIHHLTMLPARTDDILVEVTWPASRKDGSKHPQLHQFETLQASYLRKLQHHYAQVDYGPLIEFLKGIGVKRSWNITTTVEYSVPAESEEADSNP